MNKATCLNVLILAVIHNLIMSHSLLHNGNDQKFNIIKAILNVKH